MSHDGKWAYVTGETSEAISVINFRPRGVTFALDGLALAPDGNRFGHRLFG